MQKHSKCPLLVGCSIGHKLHPALVLGSTWVKRKKSKHMTKTVSIIFSFFYASVFKTVVLHGKKKEKKSLNITFWKKAAFVSAIFWIHFCTVEGIKEVSSNFIVNGENSQPFSVCFLHPNKALMILCRRVLDC